MWHVASVLAMKANIFCNMTPNVFSGIRDTQQEIVCVILIFCTTVISHKTKMTMKFPGCVDTTSHPWESYRWAELRARCVTSQTFTND